MKEGKKKEKTVKWVKDQRKEFCMNLQEIEHAIANLNSQDLARLRRWFKKFDVQKRDELEKLAIQKRVRELRGSLKGSGGLKALMEERRKGQ
jgi:predicted transcriptional regulator of viral defense system